MTIAPISRRITLALGLLSLGGFWALNLSAQAPAGRQKLTFIAVSADGQPVAGLKPSQLDVKVDGKARQVQSLELVKLGGAGDAAAPKALFDNPIPPPYGENLATPGRNIMLAIDEESMRPGSDKPLKEALDQFIGALGATDRASLITMPHGTIAVDLTSNKTALRDAIAKVGGRLPQGRNDDEDRCHTRDVLDTMTSVFTRITDNPATVVVFSSGLVSPSSATGTCQASSTEFQKLQTAAGASHATVYVVLPETSVATSEMAGLQNLAGTVSSPLLNLANSDAPLTKILRESGAYYVAEIDYDAAERDGKSHRLDLKVTAPGAAVRAPVEVTFAKADPKATKLVAKDLVKDGKTYTDLPIRVIAYASKGAQDKIKLVAMVAPVDPTVKFASVSIGFTDPNGKGQTYTLGTEELARTMILAPLEVAPGNYRVHAAAVDASGRAGSADYQVDATLVPAGPMRLSGITLGVNGTSGFSFKTAFQEEPEATAYFELYGTTQSGLSLAVEIAETPDGPAIKTGEPKLGATTDKERFVCLTAFDIKDLKPGDYVVRVTFQVGETPAGKVFRTLRKLK